MSANRAIKHKISFSKSKVVKGLYKFQVVKSET